MPRAQGTVDDDIENKLKLGEFDAARELNRLELQSMNDEAFRHRFMDRNRPWVLQHLTELLTPRTLQMPGALTRGCDVSLLACVDAHCARRAGGDGRPNIEYIRDVYNDLVSMTEGGRLAGDREDISDDEGEGVDSKRRQNWSKRPITGASKDLMMLWLRKSRTRRVYRRLIQVCFALVVPCVGRQAQADRTACRVSWTRT